VVAIEVVLGLVLTIMELKQLSQAALNVNSSSEQPVILTE